MKINCSKFNDKERIPKKYTCDGKDISPPLEISDIPEEAKYISIIMDDPDAPGGTFDHWIIWNIPADMNKIPEKVPADEKVSSLERAPQGKNGFGEIGYRGPCPPSGPEHKYHFKAFAVSKKIDLNPGISKSDLENKMEDKIIEKDSIIGTYGR